MRITPQSIQRLIREFNTLPGIGRKTSERFVFFLLRQEPEAIDRMAAALLEIKDKVQLCTECYTYTEDILCSICREPGRNRQEICVVAEPKDVITIEATGEFHGVYHVLGGVIDHTIGMGPQHLRVDELRSRIEADHVTEVIIATNPTMEGETTAVYLRDNLQAVPVTVSRIARGLPSGADITFADNVTLGNALTARQKISE